jgi:sec-independent protein translocase protein TatA
MEFFTPGHLIVLAIVALVLFFGWKQLPEMSRSLGRSLRIFKTEIKGMSEDDKARERAKEAPAQPPALAAPPVTSSDIAPVVPAQPESASVDAQRARPRPAPGPGSAPAARPADNATVNGSTAVNGRASTSVPGEE